MPDDPQNPQGNDGGGEQQGNGGQQEYVNPFLPNDEDGGGKEKKSDPAPKSPEKKPDLSSNNFQMEDDEREAVSRIARENSESIYNEKVDPAIQETNQKVSGVERTLALNDFMNEYPEFGDYKQAIVKQMNKPMFSGLPVPLVAFAIAGPGLLQLGAKRERDTQQKVDGTKEFGRSVRPGPSKPKDWSSASMEEVRKERERIMRQV